MLYDGCKDDALLFMRSNFSGRTTRSCSLLNFFVTFRILRSILSHGRRRLLFRRGGGGAFIVPFVGLALNRNMGSGDHDVSRRVKALLLPLALPDIGRPLVTKGCGEIMVVLTDPGKDGSDSAKRSHIHNNRNKCTCLVIQSRTL